MRSVSILLAGISCLAPVPAYAEEIDEAEITVTGIRQAYRGDFDKKEIPQAIATIDAKQLEDNNILRLTDALDLNASVARQNTLGGLWDAFAIRGFAGDENLPSGYLVNGFNGGRGFGGQRDVAGIERIEVLKGPAAALLGRGEPGGTINIVTKQPVYGNSFGTAALQYGSFDRLRAEADANLAIGQNLSVRLVGYAEEADSFRDTIESNRRGFLPSVGLRLGDQTRLTYDLEWTRVAVPFDRGIVVLNNNLKTVPRSRFLGEPGDGDHVAQAEGHQLRLQHDFNDKWSMQLGVSHRDTLLTGQSSDAELVRSRQKLFVDGQSLSRQRRSRVYDSEHFVVRGEVSGEFEFGGMRHRILFGADYDKFENDQDFRRFRPPAVSGNPSDLAANIINILNPAYGRFPLPTPARLTNRVDIQKSTGFYLQDQINLIDRLQVRIGARYDDFQLQTNNRITSILSARKASRLSPQAGLVFEASDSISLYAVYGEGFRANIGTDAAGRIFDPETSQSIEVGTKLSLLDGKLTGTFSLYEMKKSNVLATDTANPGFLVTVGKARSRGAEMDIAGKITSRLSLLFSYAYTDAESRSLILDPNFSFQIRPGDPLINIPKHSLNVQLTQDFTLGSMNGKIGAGLQHVGKRSGETGTAFKLPSHNLVRLFGQFELTEGVELFGEVRNLFNAHWYANSYASLWVQPGTPRAASIGVRSRF